MNFYDKKHDHRVPLEVARGMLSSDSEQTLSQDSLDEVSMSPK